jgi:hypothetical protein
MRRKIELLRNIALRIRRNRVHLTVFILMTCCVVYFMTLLSYHHPLRASLSKVYIVSDSAFFTIPLTASNSKLRFEDVNCVTVFREEIPDTLVKDQWTSAKNVMAWIGNGYTYDGIVQNLSVPESADDILSYKLNFNQRGSCYNDAILLSTYLQSLSIPVRLIELGSNDGLGGNGHNVIEMWSDEFKKWIVMDQQNVAWFSYRSNNIPLSAIEMHHDLFHYDSTDFNKRIEIHQQPGFYVDSASIYKYYRTVYQELLIVANGDFYTAKNTLLARRISNLIERQEPYIGKKAVLIGRLFRSMFGDPFVRYKYQDDLSSDYNYDSWFYMFRFVSYLFIGGIIYFVFITIRFRFRRHRARAAQATKTAVVKNEQAEYSS